ncbi:protein NATD1 isoform X2 [Engraulis encrasicolus]|uniref:protein NATD1 isoform X2 n=1 Tax=Engraulis encrasicolus TaxID=184585 RepID=UPI002FD0199D
MKTLNCTLPFEPRLVVVCVLRCAATTKMSLLFHRSLRHCLATTNILKAGRIRHCATDADQKPKTIHDRAAQLFTVCLDGTGSDNTATLRYSLKGAGEVDLLSTQVPESFRGKGVAAQLAKAALDFVVEEKLKARIYCWYIKKYVDENPALGYKDHIVE